MMKVTTSDQGTSKRHFRFENHHNKKHHGTTPAMSDPAIPLYDYPPMAPPTAPSAINDSPLDNMQVRQMLQQQGYTTGLIEALRRNKLAYAQSIWVVDNSGSMQTRDGHRIVSGKTSESALKFVECSRWAEMQQTVDYHAQMAALLHAPTTFRLLNDPGRVCGPQIFSIAVPDPAGNSQIDEELSIAVSTMQNTQPGGVTPLTQHVQAIRQHILSMQSQLSHNGTKVAIVLATDGLPSDAQGYSNDSVKSDFVSALRSLEGLPVWIVVRLCTDEDDVVQYWNDLDSQLELSLEVLDDFESEAKEVHTMNPWLTYSLPLHRMREMGFHHSILDLLDERKLSRDEVRDVLRILFGSYEAPDPEENWMGFCSVVEQLLAKEKKVWNPVVKKVMPWIDLKQLNRQYGPAACVIC
jgi:Mg-chelatase subunit ChlD